MSLNMELLRKHIKAWQAKLVKDPIRAEHDKQERDTRAVYYRSQTAEKIRGVSADDFYEYVSKLWALLGWGNKKYVVDKLLADNEFGKLKTELAELVWGDLPIEQRWDRCRSLIKGMGPAMMSEILCQTHSEDYMLWNRRAYVGLHFLGVDELPRYNWQVTGKRYRSLCNLAKEIAQEMRGQGIPDADLLTLDFFIWSELQVEKNLSQIHKKVGPVEPADTKEAKPDSEAIFLHNEVRDKLEQIGAWLGFTSKTEVKVAEGAIVDGVWEASIGNLGRVIYVFEVQTKGSIDSLYLT